MMEIKGFIIDEKKCPRCNKPFDKELVIDSLITIHIIKYCESCNKHLYIVQKRDLFNTIISKEVF